MDIATNQIAQINYGGGFQELELKEIQVLNY